MEAPTFTLPEWYEFDPGEALFFAYVKEDIKRLEIRSDDPDEVAKKLLALNRYQEYLKSGHVAGEIIYVVKITLTLMKLYPDDTFGGNDEFQHQLIEAKRIVENNSPVDDDQLPETLEAVRAPILTELAKT